MQNAADLLRRLERGEKLDSRTLSELRAQGLIEVDDVTNNDTPLGQRDLLFTFITERGRRLLAKAIVIVAAATLSAKTLMAEYLDLPEPSHTQIELNIPDTQLSFAVPSVSGAFSEYETWAHYACPQCAGHLATMFRGRLTEWEVRNRLRIREAECDAGCDWHGFLSGREEIRLTLGQWGEPFRWDKV